MRASRYASTEDAVNAAVARVRAEEALMAEDLHDGELAAIGEGLAQADRGDVRPWAEVREKLGAKYIRPRPMAGKPAR